MKDKKSIVIAIFVIGCIGINCAGKAVAAAFSLPFWLDSVGTVLAANALGPVCGAIVGASVNVIFGFWKLTSAAYALTSIAVGIIVGLCAKHNMLRDWFGALTAGFLVALASVCVSTPLNLLLDDGYTGNLWGDAVIDFLREQGVHRLVCFVTGEFYVDFVDKALLLLLFSVGLRLYKRIRIRREILGALALLAVVAAPAQAYAAQSGDGDYNTYVQTIYNADNGLTGGTATDIEQTNDGVLWIGTYNGLYRYNGSSFQWMDGFDSVKNVNCLYTDEEGRLWIGTNDNGLSLCINDSVTNVLDTDSGMPSDSVRCIVSSSNGYSYVGTTGSMAVVTLTSGISIVETLPEITYASSAAVNADGLAATVTDAGTLYLIDGTDVTKSISSEDEGSVYTCCAFGEDGTLYVGTAENRIEQWETDGQKLTKTGDIFCGELSNIKEIAVQETGECFVCADNGAGYLDETGTYHSLNTNKFNSSIDHMLTDYQGNLWFTSSRLGLLKLCSSVFTELYDELGMEESVVNAVTVWNGAMYFGTDSGLDMADVSLTQQLTSELTERLSGVRVRNLMVDSADRLWIATSGSGTLCVTKSGGITTYNSASGTLGDKFRMSLELSDGTVALAGDYGITFVKDGKVTGTVGTDDGLENPKVLCMLELSDGSLLAGTDGNGIAVLNNQKVTSVIGRADGLSSGVILRICQDEGGSGCFVVTGNGLCYLEDGSARTLDNFPHYNNFDLVQHDGKLFVLGSAGIYVVSRQALLDGGELEYVLLDSKKGLCNSLTSNAWTYTDQDDVLYLPESAGVAALDLDDYDVTMRSYRMQLRSVTVDGVSYPVEQSTQISLQSGANRIEITPEIINYSANDPYVSVYLEGVDSTAQVIRQSELTSVVYANLPAGTYTLYISVLDEKNTVLSEKRFYIQKEYEFYERRIFQGYFIVIFVLTIAYLVLLLFRTQVQRTLSIQRRELDVARKQAQMGNEAILTIARTVDAKDTSTRQHSARVADYSVRIARKIGYGKAQLEELRKTALLHDIGKIGIPDRILNKPDRLTDEEYEIMKSHVTTGAEILKNFTMIDHIDEGALYHHERYDGSGYVYGLKGEEIPLNARIIGIADAFDAMTANRVYRRQMDFAYVVEELKKGRGTQFDPKLVDVMLELLESGEINIQAIYRENEAF